MTDVAIATFLAAFARASAFFFTAPLVGDRGTPAKVRVAAAAALAMVIAPVRPPLELAALPGVIPGELLLGALAGFIGKLVFAAAEAGGQLIALNMGLGMANTFDPTMNESASVTRRIALVLAGLAFLLTGGLQSSVHVVAAAPYPDVEGLLTIMSALVKRSGEVLDVGVRFAAPVMLAGLVANLGVALASKAAPALNIFSVMLATILIVGGVTLLVNGPAFIKEMTMLGERVPRAIAEAFGG